MYIIVVVDCSGAKGSPIIMMLKRGNQEGYPSSDTRDNRGSRTSICKPVVKSSSLSPSTILPPMVLPGEYDLNNTRAMLVNLDSYQHLPLGSNAIRVLGILPSLSYSAPIRITLQQAILEETLYAALSYVWGEPKDKVPIEIDGKFIHVTKNCQAALRALRHSMDTKIVWVDAICINQDNSEEKSDQVALMGDIYRKAERTFAWLGPDGLTEDLAKAEEELKHAAEVIEELALQEGKDFEAFYRAIYGGKLRWQVGCLKRVFGHKWWDRLWIYQESLLSKDILLMLSATNQVSWRTLCAASQVVKRHTESPAPWIRKDHLGESDRNYRLWKDLMAVDFGNAYARAELRERMQHTFRSEQSAMDLLTSQDDNEVRLALLNVVAAKRLAQNLNITRNLECFNPRDRVFALLNVTASEVKLMTPTYRSTVSDVYWKSAAAIAHWTLDFLRSAGIGLLTPDVTAMAGLKGVQIATDIPSWVPNWQLAHSLPEYAQRFAGKFSASGDETGMTEVLDDARTLHVGGFAVDDVERVLPRPFKDIHQSVLEAFPCTSRNRRARKEERRKRLQNMIRTWAADTDHLGRRLTEETVKGWMEGTMMSVYEESDHDEEDEDGEEEEDEEEEDDYDDPGDEIGYSRFMDGMIGFGQASKNKARNLLRTRQGRMALGPTGTLPGDVICILYECSVPLLLRKDTDSDYFRLVGECYVHGLMDGEALRFRKWPRTFKIR
jgi:Heterokaryon incompatibility protein (HET)